MGLFWGEHGRFLRVDEPIGFLPLKRGRPTPFLPLAGTLQKKKVAGTPAFVHTRFKFLFGKDLEVSPKKPQEESAVETDTSP